MAPWLRSVQKRDELMINGSVIAQLGLGQTKYCIDEKTEKNEQKRQRGARGESGSLQTVPSLPPMQCGEPPTQPNASRPCHPPQVVNHSLTTGTRVSCASQGARHAGVQHEPLKSMNLPAIACYKVSPMRMPVLLLPVGQRWMADRCLS